MLVHVQFAKANSTENQSSASQTVWEETPPITSGCFSPMASNAENISMSWYHHSLQWRHNGRDGVSNHQPPHCLLNRLFRRRSKKTSKLRITGLCVGNSPLTGEFLAQRAINAENISIWWRHHVWFWLMWCNRFARSRIVTPNQVCCFFER